MHFFASFCSVKDFDFLQGIISSHGSCAIVVSHGSNLISALARACNIGYNMTEVPRSKDRHKRSHDEVKGRRSISLDPSSGSEAASERARRMPTPHKHETRSPIRDDDSYTYDESTPEQEKRQKKDQKRDAKDARNRDQPDKGPSKRGRSRERGNDKNHKIQKRSRKEPEDDQEGMNCPICHEWLKNRYEAWKSHQKTSVRCAARRGEADTRKECSRCGKWVANNRFSWEQHNYSCKTSRFVLRDNRRQDDRDHRDHRSSRSELDTTEVEQSSHRRRDAQPESHWEEAAPNPRGHQRPPEPDHPPPHALVPAQMRPWRVTRTTEEATSWQRWQEPEQQGHWPPTHSSASSSSPSVIQPLTALFMGMAGLLQHHR